MGHLFAGAVTYIFLNVLSLELRLLQFMRFLLHRFCWRFYAADFMIAGLIVLFFNVSKWPRISKALQPVYLLLFVF